MPLSNWVTVAGVAIVLSASGCAHVEVSHVDPADTSDGVHFYEPRPYLLIAMETKKDAKGVETNEYTNQILWLPNPSQRYKVEVHPGWGTVDGNVKLLNGWMLTELGAKSDSKIPETIAAIAGLVKEAAAAGAATPQQGLYRIDIDASGSVTLVRQVGWR